MSKITQELEAFKRKLLEERLAKLTAPQLEFFKRLFPEQVIAEDKLISVIDLCDRTIAKNEAALNASVEKAWRRFEQTVNKG